MKTARWSIAFEDEYIMVVDKPAGLLTIPDRYNDELPNLLDSLKSYREEIFVNHRLDRDTSGLILFSKSEKAHKAFSDLFENRQISKHYLTLVHGKPIEDIGLIELNLLQSNSSVKKMIVDTRGKQAITKYRIIKTWHQYSLLEVKLITGRMHQIRAHMQSINCPIICDLLYGDGQALFLSDFKKKYRQSSHKEERPLLQRQALHSSELHFKHPFTSEEINIVAELPKDMKAAINQMDSNLNS